MASHLRPKRPSLTPGQQAEIREAQARMARQRMDRNGYSLPSTIWSKIALGAVVVFFIAFRIIRYLWRHDS